MSRSKRTTFRALDVVISNRAFAISGWVLAGIAGALAIHFHSEARDLPELSYTIKPLRTAVVNRAVRSKLSVEYEHRRIDTDITAAEVVLWNAGSRPIRTTDLLEPVVVHTESDTPILEASIRRITRDATGFELETNRLDTGRIEARWNILEQGDGATIQITYAGEPTLGISVSGSVVGQREITRLEAPEGTIYRTAFPRRARKAFQVVEISYAMIGIMIIYAGFK